VKRILTWLFWAPLAIILIVVAVANRHWVTFSLDPLSRSDPVFAVEMPMFVLLFAAILAGLMIGGAASWINQGKWRRAAREGLSEAAHWRREAARSHPEPDRGEDSLRLPSPGAR
jgi:uncharacterized integral membrane protein